MFNLGFDVLCLSHDYPPVPFNETPNNDNR